MSEPADVEMVTHLRLFGCYYYRLPIFSWVAIQAGVVIDSARMRLVMFLLTVSHSLRSNVYVPDPYVKKSYEDCVSSFTCINDCKVSIETYGKMYRNEYAFNLTKIDRWFLVQIKEIVDFEEELAALKN